MVYINIMASKPMKPVFADPKLDLPFKKIFGTQEHKNLLIDLLNHLLRLPPSARILDAEYLSGEQLPPHEGLKRPLRVPEWEPVGTCGRRNRLLGRISTDEETEFLKQPGSSF